MPETARPPESPALGRGDRRHRCHECGEPIRGIEAVAPGAHRFAGCGHPASARFVERPAATTSTLVRFSLE